MLKAYRKSILIVCVALLSLVVATGFAFGTSITLDAIEDAGQYPGQAAYVEFQPNGPIITTQDVAIKWASAPAVYDYASSKSINWSSLESAGNIWSSDTVVGDSLAVTPGTYRITPIGGAFEFDSFGWSNWQGWWWEMHVQVTGNPTDYILGAPPSGSSADIGYATPGDALTAVSNYYLDLTVPEGGSLTFWIKDFDFIHNTGDTIDNFGSLTFEVTPIPEPVTILLLSLGLIGIPGIRRFIK